MKSSLKLALIAYSLLFLHNAAAWDSVGHRLTAAVAIEHLSTETTAQLISILRQHPRFEQDFQNAIPRFIDRSDSDDLNRWLLGQAAFWPDLARGLPEAQARRYNHANWHYIDGAWLRGAAQAQGNTYVGIDPFPAIEGIGAADIGSIGQVGNVANALDYNTHVLADNNQAMATRAVALCWVLHLVGDIHQPLHTGSLYSAELFERGDRGGNGIPTDSGNLHARWDRALNEEGFLANLPAILQQLTTSDEREARSLEADWTVWMAESRQYLPGDVYNDAMRRAILDAERGDSRLPKQTLSPQYVEDMKAISRHRLGLAGLRLAAWFEREIKP